jgi:Protein of unknown function (DUF3024)
MAFEFENEIEIIEVMEAYLMHSRPPEEIRNQIDLGYKVEEQSVIVFEIVPNWRNPIEKMEHNVAKATYIKKDNNWKIFWFKSDMKWHNYNPIPKVPNLKTFVKVINDDEHNCFWG